MSFRILEICIVIMYVVYVRAQLDYAPPKMENPATVRVYVAKTMVKMTEEILKDVNMKMMHVEKYVDMYRGKTSFEMGAAAGEMYGRFKKMLKIYREWTKIPKEKPWQFVNQMKRDVWRWNIDNFLGRLIVNFQIVHGEYNEILYARHVFYETIEKAHIARKKKIEEMHENRMKQMMLATARRRFESKPEKSHLEALAGRFESQLTQPELKQNQISQKAQPDTYVDYWGHIVNRQEEKLKVKERNQDRFDEAFREDLEFKFASFFNPNHSESNALLMNEKEQFINETYDMLARQVKKREFIEKMKEKTEKEWQDRVRVDDDDYRRGLRQRSFEIRRANFSPEREGIDVDLSDML